MRKLALFALLFTLPALADHGCTHRAALSCPAQGAAGALVSSDCAAFDGSRFDLWQFSGNAGDEITLELSSTAFDGLLMLLDPNMVPVAQNDDRAGGATDSRIVFTLTSSGTWTVVANSLAVAGTGDYVLSLSCPATETGPKRRAVRK